MTGEIIDLGEKQMERGEPMFLACERCGEGSYFAVQILKNKQGVFISMLVCVGDKCEGQGTAFEVTGGVVQP